MANRSRVEAVVSLFVTVHPHELPSLLHAFTCFFFLLSAYFVILPLRDEGAISLGLGKLPGLFMASLALTFIAAPASTYIFSLSHLSKGKVALLNLVSISATWARVIDSMNSESGSRLIGFVGAGATLGQLCGSLLAVAMAQLGPYLLLFAALLMELAARSSIGIGQDETHEPQELSSTSESVSQSVEHNFEPVNRLTASSMKHKFSAMLDGLQLILASTYLLHVCCFMWLTAVVSSFFYFQKAAVVAEAVANALDRRRMFAQVNSFTAVFILIGQLTLTGQILTSAGVTAAICAAPVISFANMTTIAIWPTWIMVAISETLRKVLNYVLTRPGREVLFTVVTRDEKYKAKVCMDVLVQRLGDAAAAGIYKILQGSLNKGPSAIALCALPVCFAWIITAFSLGRRQAHLAKSQALDQ
ncbi:uncharacterized protein LOC131034280 isoform X3 [Cryptomeria japonica]|uniref:uncharacterized protein LOC131034280 isoform X3 n=1 Tax=Cryptomeria japonica TaxID=3369 RepID=UPI0025ACB109|nr:uncharacterized protein LOC131034280 isoform X3 [Cryptomeria japonica]